MYEDPHETLQWRIFLGAVVTATLVAAFLFLGETDSRSRPVELVREYLAAVQAGDTGTARELAGVSPSADDPADHFLDGAASAGDWTVSSVRAEPDVVDDRKMTVRYRVDIPGSGMVDGYFTTRQDEQTDDWRIEDPLAEVILPDTPLWYQDLNGVTAPRAAAPESGEPRQSYRLFPGVYRLYGGPNPLVDVADEPLALFPGTAILRGEGKLLAPQISLTDTGEAAANRAVAALIDQCADSNDHQLVGCPLSMRFLTVSVDGIPVDWITEVEWSVESYPDLAFDMDGLAIVVVDRQPGVARIAATGYSHDDPGTGHPGSGLCPISGAGLVIGIEVDGSMSVVPNETGNGWSPNGPHYGSWDTCEL